MTTIRTTLLGLAALILLAAPALPQDKKPPAPVNQTCPVNAAGLDPKYTVVVQGKLIGFCSRLCYNKFVGNMSLYLPNVPGFEGKKKAEDKPGEDKDKKDAKPANYGPCECKKTVKGWYCLECKRELTPDDVRKDLCKRCETKPASIEYCLKVTPPFLHPGEKAPRSDEDRARVTYECETCGVKGEIESEFKHKPDCKPSFGSGVKKICTKSGTAPHLGEEKK